MSDILVHYFPCGGYCLHKITGDFSGHVSAWFKPDGSILDAEHFGGEGDSLVRRVKKGGPIWNAVAAVGRAYVLPASEIGV